MNIDENEDETVDRLLVNHDEEFSVWPADQDGPNWRDLGKSGLKEQSPAHIKEFWTGMRLFSLKKRA
jgi:MbtH protein